MSGIRVSYNKNEVFVVGMNQDGMNQEEREKVANAFNCQVGSFLMKYLGLPVRDHRLVKSELSGSAFKMDKRLETFKSH